MPDGVFALSPRITLIPVVHGSGDVAVEIRRRMLANASDCLAVPLPRSFQRAVEDAIRLLPQPTLVLQRRANPFSWPTEGWNAHSADEDGESCAGQVGNNALSYVPIDPCQPVIAAIRTAMGERIPRAFIDLETDRFLPWTRPLPDAYALKRVAFERFAAAVLPTLEPPPLGQPCRRIARMARRLHELEQRFESVLALCSILDWPWLRDAYLGGVDDPIDEDVGDVDVFEPSERTLIFLLGELPFVTALYEQARSDLEDDDNLSVDGVKELLIASRVAYRAEWTDRARSITPHLLAVMLKYIRNLSLIERRFTPDLYTLVTAAKQIAGDAFASHVAETARDYPLLRSTGLDTITLGVDRGRLPDGATVPLVSRLSGPPLIWRRCELSRPSSPRAIERWKWRIQWNPYEQCSFPPEDDRIECFRSHVFDRAKAVMGADLARTEKFTTSIKDGIDIRDTLRHWYSGDIYVKVVPPARGDLNCAVMLFEFPADPRAFTWRVTWYAEHDAESTLAFYATDYMENLVGPGIASASYGGSMFLFPPVSIPDVWTDPRLDFAETLEERLLAAACLHSRSRQIALLSPAPPGAGWRRLAKRFGRQFVHLPLGQFSESTLRELRQVHVLDGRHVRSYAARYIRRS
ncbi:MAG: hypothetical protein FJ297_06380 [Planctomycetes bacterium]|nr:hypothetical protein [Planctomycetota bacterium]